MDMYDIINELLENNDYKANSAEILEKYFEQNPECFKEWSDWFNKKEAKR